MMYSSPLYLSHWNDSTPVIVGENCVKELTDYNLLGIRFLYDCFRRQQKGAILNHEDGMNSELQVSAFLNAYSCTISSTNPVLVICSEDTLPYWHYHLVSHGEFSITVLSTTSVDEILLGTKYCVVLSTLNATEELKKIKEISFFCVVIEELDKLVLKRIVQQIKGQFHIGLTSLNFVKHGDQKLFWKMVNWSNPGVLGKFSEFCKDDDEHARNLRNPYSNWWHRLTWKYCESFIPPTDSNLKEYHCKVREWSVVHNITKHCISKSENNIKTRKRKLPRQVCADPKNDTSKIRKLEEQSIKHEPNLDDSMITTLKEDNMVNASDDSNDTIIYDIKGLLEDTDDDCILSSIISGTPLCIPSVSAATDSIMSDYEAEPSTSRKNELVSLLYGSDD